ncbi:uncharacterized protein LOC135694143 isoform X2 [Rhopilema esculentum]
MATSHTVNTRRKTRKMKSEGVVNDAEYMIKQGKYLTGLCKTYLGDYVGWGVINASYKYIPKGLFVLEYAGELLSKEEADRREIKYNQTGCGSYMFYFKPKGQDL